MYYEFNQFTVFFCATALKIYNNCKQKRMTLSSRLAERHARKSCSRVCNKKKVNELCCLG